MFPHLTNDSTWHINFWFKTFLFKAFPLGKKNEMRSMCNQLSN